MPRPDILEGKHVIAGVNISHNHRDIQCGALSTRVGPDMVISDLRICGEPIEKRSLAEDKNEQFHRYSDKASPLGNF